MRRLLACSTRLDQPATGSTIRLSRVGRASVAAQIADVQDRSRRSTRRSRPRRRPSRTRGPRRERVAEVPPRDAGDRRHQAERRHLAEERTSIRARRFASRTSPATSDRRRRAPGSAAPPTAGTPRAIDERDQPGRDRQPVRRPGRGPCRARRPGPWRGRWRRRPSRWRARPRTATSPTSVVSGSTISATKSGDQRDPQERQEVRDREDAVGARARRRSSRRTPPIASGRRDSNPRPSDPQSDALTKLRHGPCASYRVYRARPSTAAGSRSRIGTPSSSKRAPEPVLEEPLVARRRGARRRTARTRRAARPPAWRSGTGRRPGAGCSACAAATTSFTVAVGARRIQRSWTCEQDRRAGGGRPCPSDRGGPQHGRSRVRRKQLGAELLEGPVALLDQVPLVRDHDEPAADARSRERRSACPRP